VIADAVCGSQDQFDAVPETLDLISKLLWESEVAGDALGNPREIGRTEELCLPIQVVESVVRIRGDGEYAHQVQRVLRGDVHPPSRISLQERISFRDNEQVHAQGVREEFVEDRDPAAFLRWPMQVSEVGDSMAHRPWRLRVDDQPLSAGLVLCDFRSLCLAEAPVYVLVLGWSPDNPVPAVAEPVKPLNDRIVRENGIFEGGRVHDDGEKGSCAPGALERIALSIVKHRSDEVRGFEPTLGEPIERVVHRKISASP
jgi:hypothetical protein